MGHKLTQHHRLPKSKGGGSDSNNIAYVRDKKHKAWHLLFETKEPEKIVWELNNVWLPPNVKLVLVKTE